MTIAAVYARKSTEQIGFGDDQRSVTRPVENAKAFAASKGWTVSAAHVYTDDGDSGAETTRLRERARVTAAAARGEFDVVVMQRRIGSVVGTATRPSAN